MPPVAGPDAGKLVKTILCENSEVLPEGSVAVALTRSPGWIVVARVTSIAARPEPSVVTWVEPM